MEWVFYLMVSVVLYVYMGYPVLMKALSFGKRPAVREINGFPSVTLIIAAHNEEKVIGGKIENVLSGDFPKDKLQVIVASDASTDGTNEIVRAYSGKGVELYDQKEHKGKSAALNHIVGNLARGEIVIFNDSTTILEKDAISNICRHFSNEDVGAAAARLIFRKTSASAIAGNHGLYWRYEEFIRKMEGRAGYLPFVSGAFYAIRKGLYTRVPADMPDDSVSPLGVYRQGRAVAYAEDSLAYETGAKDPSGEFRVKTRGIIRELTSIYHFRDLLNPLKYPVLSLVLVSHRLLRWSVPFFLIVIFMDSLYLRGHLLYGIFLWTQVIFYLIALYGLMSRRNIRVASMASYFSLVNTAALWAIIRFLCGERKSTWRPER
ncbi:MAG: glycosyltransferase family 2 protein [Deltaproteobacteria bacterium]|nr:glycosyltransferase family 2 protein [Deltaproteobacteria bacterium]